MRFTLPDSALTSASLDDPAMQKEYGLTVVEGTKRWTFEGPLTAFIEVVDHCIHMDLDHGGEDLQMGCTYTRNAGKWARKQAAKLLASGQAVRDGFGGIKPRS